MWQLRWRKRVQFFDAAGWMAGTASVL